MLNKVEIIILTENRVGDKHLQAENGLSLYIASPEGDFLFDTGLDSAFLHNADALGIDLGKKVNRIIFSHGHRDHTGGIKFYLERFHKATVICHFNIFNRKYRVLEGGRLEVGMPYEENELVKLGGKFVYKTHPFELSNNILTTGEIPRRVAFEKVAEKHQQMVFNDYISDELNDDMALIIKSSNGLIVLTGDCHSGVINTLQYAMQITNIKKIHCLMGGLNLIDASAEKIEKTIEELLKIDPDFVVPLHSTGFRAMNHLYNAFGERTLQLNIGDRFVLEN